MTSQEDNVYENRRTGCDCARYWPEMRSAIRSVDGKLDQLLDVVSGALEEKQGHGRNGWDPGDLEDIGFPDD